MKRFLCNLSIIAMIMILTPTLYSSCSNSDSRSKKSTTTTNYNGTYYWSEYPFSHTITIHGNTWSSKWVAGDNVKYSSGTVQGNVLYHPSGVVTFATISGNTIRLNNRTLVKQ